MPRPSKLPYHLLQSIRVPKDHRGIPQRGSERRRELAAQEIARRYFAGPGLPATETKSRLVNFYGFRVTEPKRVDKATYKTFVAPSGVQLVSARLKPAIENRVLRRRPGYVVFERGKLLVLVRPARGAWSAKAIAALPTSATPKQLIRAYGRARIRILG